MKLKFKKSKKPFLFSEKDIPEDLGIKIGTKEEVLWTKVRDSRKAQIEQYEEALIVERAILELAESKIKQEKKFN